MGAETIGDSVLVLCGRYLKYCKITGGLQKTLNKEFTTALYNFGENVEIFNLRYTQDNNII